MRRRHEEGEEQRKERERKKQEKQLGAAAFSRPLPLASQNSEHLVSSPNLSLTSERRRLGVDSDVNVRQVVDGPGGLGGVVLGLGVGLATEVHGVLRGDCFSFGSSGRRLDCAHGDGGPANRGPLPGKGGGGADGADGGDGGHFRGVGGGRREGGRLDGGFLRRKADEGRVKWTCGAPKKKRKFYTRVFFLRN